jgi:hypothetical protein
MVFAIFAATAPGGVVGVRVLLVSLIWRGGRGRFGLLHTSEPLAK